MRRTLLHAHLHTQLCKETQVYLYFTGVRLRTWHCRSLYPLARHLTSASPMPLKCLVFHLLPSSPPPAMKKCPHGPSVRVSPFNHLQVSLSMSPENPCAHRTGRLSETIHGPPWPKGKALTQGRRSRPYPTLFYSPNLLPTQPTSLHLSWSTHLEPSSFQASTHSVP